MFQGYLLKLFNIRQGEQKLVKELFLIEFFRGTAIAFFFTAAIKTFIDKFTYTSLASGLPIVFIISSFFLWITGYAYTKFEHKLSIEKLATIIPAFMAASIILIWVVGKFYSAAWFWYVMLCWFNVLYLLNNLQFWSIASVIYDVRQSKRLFGVISAGDIPAKLIGYSLAFWLLEKHLLLPLELLPISFICMILSIPFIYRIIKTDTLKIHTHHKHVAVTVSSKYKLTSIIRNYIGNKLIERIAILSFLFSFCYITIMYIFYGKVKIAMNIDHRFGNFILIALVTAKVLALIIMAVYTSRLMSKWGHRISLAIMPLILSVFAVALLFGSYLELNTKTLLYISGLMFLVTEALRYSIHSPVFLALMQPLPTHERLRAHNIVKGIMDPFAYLIAGVILLAANHLSNNLVDLCYLLLIVMAAWMAGIFAVAKPYFQTLMQSIARRSFNSEDFSFEDEASMNVIEQKMSAGSEAEKSYVLNLLQNKIEIPQVQSIFKKALRDESPIIRKEAIEIICEKKAKDFQDYLLSIIKSDTDPSVVATAIEGLNNPEVITKELIKYIDDANETVEIAAIKKVIHSAKGETKEKAKNKLIALASSNLSKNKIIATKILCSVQEDFSVQLLISLMKEEELEVSTAAMEASGQNAHPILVTELLSMLLLKERQVLNALEEAGVAAINPVKDYLLSENYSENLAIKLIHLLARIQDPSSCNTLVELLDLLPNYRPEIIKALHRSEYVAEEEKKNKFYELIKQYLEQAEKIMLLQEPLLQHHKKYHLLIHALKTELDEIKLILLNLYSFLYDSNKVNEIKLALYSRKKESIANAIELTELLIPKHFATPFVRILEASEAQTFNDLTHTSKTRLTPEDVCKNILRTDNMFFNKWTRAVCLYTITKNDISFEPSLIHPYTQSPDPLLKEIALVAANV